MSSEYKARLVKLLAAQTTSKTSVRKTEHLLGSHPDEIETQSDAIVEFACYLMPTKSRLGCLLAIHRLLSRSPHRSYFAVGLSEAMDALMVSFAREDADDDETLGKVYATIDSLEQKRILPPRRVQCLRNLTTPVRVVPAFAGNDDGEEVEEEKHTHPGRKTTDGKPKVVVTTSSSRTSALRSFLLLGCGAIACAATALVRCEARRSGGRSVFGAMTVSFVLASAAVVLSRRLDDREDDDRCMWRLWLSPHFLSVATVAIETGLVDYISERETTRTNEIAARFGFGKRGACAMLRVLAAAGFLRHDRAAGAWTATRKMRRFLHVESPWNWRAMLLGSKGERHEALLNVLDIDARGSGVGQLWEIGAVGSSAAESMTEQFHAHSVNAAFAFAETVIAAGVAPCSREDGKSSKMLDIAGGSGCFSTHLAARVPGLFCVVLELPVVVPETMRHVESLASSLSDASLRDRVRCVGASMWSDTTWSDAGVDDDYDAVLFSNVFHDWSLESCAGLATSALKVLRPGGRIYVHEVLLDSSRAHPVDALLSLHMLLHSSEGAQQTGEMWCRMLERVGFVDASVCDAPRGPFSVITATKRKQG